jgi:hypothetical protein
MTTAIMMCALLLLVHIATQLEMLAVERLKLRPECLVGNGILFLKPCVSSAFI